MATQNPSPPEMKEAQKRHWTSVAESWAKWFDWTGRNFAPLTALLRERMHWEGNTALLDVGCGSGYPALAAASAMEPTGKVVAIDVSSRMLEVAASRAAADGLDNISFQEMDAERLTFADEAFDAVTCVCTLMFCPDPVRAIGEMRRVLKPRGRLAIVVWDDASLNAFSMLLLGVAGQFITLPALPASKEPGPFRFAPPGELEAVLSAGGFADVLTESLAMSFEFESVDEYLQVVADVTGWKRRLEHLSDEEVSRLRTTLAEAVQPHVEEGHVRLRATVRCGVGRK